MSAEMTERIAADWLAREDRGLDPAEEAAMQGWLAQSTLNRVAYLRLKGAWDRADRLAVLRAPPTRPAPEETPRYAGWRQLAAAILFLAVSAAAAYYLLSRPPAAQTYETERGSTRQVELADGSRMQLNTDTRLRAEVTGTSRTVTLVSGEAFFDVVHDEKRPFTVYAGNRRITDLGTRFSVYRKNDDVRVTVQEGRVRVDLLDNPALSSPVVAEGGHAVIARGAETLLIAKSAGDIANDLSWRGGMLVFNQQTLSEVAEQFNRYNNQQIVVEGGARRIRIGGSFRQDNVAGFAALLHQGFGLTVSRRGDDIIVSR
jgi:transmembrane sensor